MTEKICRNCGHEIIKKQIARRERIDLPNWAWVHYASDDKKWISKYCFCNCKSPAPAEKEVRK